MPVSYAELYRCYVRCRRNKRNTINALKFETRQELALLELMDELNSRRYWPGRSVCFVTRKPKLREIFAADFRDRIVHHLVVDHLERHWERVFIHDSYACRKGKGVHRAVDRLQTFLHQLTRSGKRPAWYLQLDIRNYFMRIDKARLWEMLEPCIDDPWLRWLTRRLVFHDCASDYVARSGQSLLGRVPAHKSLRHTGSARGLPIGNLNSQFFANVYLNGLDQFVKHELRCRHYLRYCDDFILLADSREQLDGWRADIEHYLYESLGLTLNAAHTRLRPVGNGIDFLGYILYPDYRLVRRRVVGNLVDRLIAFRRRYVRECNGWAEITFDLPALRRLRAVLASYRGHFAHADSHRLWRSLWDRFEFLRWLFSDDDRRAVLMPRYEMPPNPCTVRSQYLACRRRYPDVIVLMQVGRFIELYAAEDDATCRHLGLKPLTPNRRRARFGFPRTLLGSFARTLQSHGRAVLHIAESDQPCPARIRCRAPAWLRYPTESGRLEPG
ncbi:MAG: reverse transcriptase [Chromatiaceae bacterium]|nr:reverse transcriptase [Chromatiaceae bacterium]